MENRYKAIITTKNIYEEIDLSPEQDAIVIGTTRNSTMRFSRRLFFDDFEIVLQKTKDGWRAGCGSNLYFTDDGILKLNSKDLEHGDELTFRSQNGGYEVLRLSYMLDFNYSQKNYDAVIDLAGTHVVSVGSSAGNTIRLYDPLIGSAGFTMTSAADGYRITQISGKYGVTINGLLAKEGDILRDTDFISIGDRSFYLKDDTLHTDPANLDAGSLHVSLKKESESDLVYPDFSRSGRVKQLIPKEDIKILPPEQKKEKPQNNMLTSILPMATMAGMMIVMGGVTGRDPSYMLYSMGSMGAGGIVAAVTYRKQKKEWAEQTVKREEKYKAYIEKKEAQIAKTQQQEQRIRNEVFASPLECLRRIERFDSILFSREPQDDDFLTVHLGLARMTANCRPAADIQERISLEDPLMEVPEKTVKKYEYIESVPVTAELKNMSALGIAGDTEWVYDYTRGITADLSANHFFTELKLFFIGDDPDYRKNFDWVKWSPHIINDDIDMNNLGFDEESRGALYEYLYAVLKYRMENKIKTVSEKDPHFVIFVYDPSLLADHPLFKSIAEAGEYGFTFVFSASCKDYLPAGCGAIVTLDGAENKGSVVWTDDADSKIEFAYEPVDKKRTAQSVRKLAGVRIKAPGEDSDLKNNISLFETFKAYGAQDIDLAYSWATSQAYRSLAAPLGVNAKNELFLMDIHEKAHGPHGLIAGTTGSGKSELLQSYLLSLAATYHPHDLAFVIIDFKGDALARQFQNLPHLMGSVTNLAGKEIERFLLSVKAENARREHLFAQAEVKNADDYMKLYKSGKVSTPVPHLIIVVDEFAELKQNYPDFMNELVSVARVGRSLGVHLILATQKPAGLVSEQIESNTRFRICLKVQTEQDSMEVLKSPLAAEITEPGRAYVKVGANELFMKFQSAYSGGPAVMENDGSTFREYSISAVDFNGRATEIFNSAKVLKRQRTDAAEDGTQKETQAKALIDHIVNFAEANDIQSAGKICLPPLGENIPYVPVDDKRGGAIRARIGVTDKPELQAQPALYINFTQENTLAIGSARYGKTYLLKTIIRDLAQHYDPDEVNIYIIDFNSKILKTFEDLAHVGGVVTDSEDEKLKNLLKMLDAEIDFRKEFLAREGVSSYEAYKQSGGSALPQIVLMIDNLTSLKEMYFEDEDPLARITREGLSLGISTVIANTQTQAVGYRNMANFSNRIAFTLNDSNEYYSLFDRCRKKPEDRAGSCLVEQDREIYEAQILNAFEGETELLQAQNAKRFIESVNRKYAGKKAREIPLIPELLSAAELSAHASRVKLQSGHILIGLDYASVEPVALDISKMGALGLFGKERSGKTNFLRHLMASANQSADAEIHVIDDYRKKLSGSARLANAKTYTVDPDEAKGIIKNVHARLKERLKCLIDEKPLKDNAHILLIFNNTDVPDVIQTDMKVGALYKEITGKLKNLGVSVIIGGIPNSAIQYSAPDALKSLKEPLNFIAFEDMKNIRVFDVSYNTQKAYKKPLDVGDAYLIRGDQITKLKTALCE